MDAPPVIQTRTAPLEINDEVIAVGYAPDRAGNEDVLGRKPGAIVPVDQRKPIKTNWSGMDDFKNAPPSYEVWAEQYSSYTRTFLLNYGALLHEVDDMMQDLMARFIERDSLGVFSVQWGSRSEDGRSNFRSYYSRFLLSYIPGKKRNSAKHNRRNLLIMDAPISGEEATTWGDVHAEARVDEDPTLAEFGEVIAQVRGRVGPELVDAVLALAQDGPVRQKALGEVLGDPKRAATGLKAVRAALSELLGE